MKRAVVCVATTERYQRGMARLFRTLPRFMNPHYSPYAFDHILVDWPSHEAKPYAFKAYALKQAADEGADLVLWCDACILPIRSMEPLWEKIEREGYWICNNGYTNYEWTADSAYPDLFPTSSYYGTSGNYMDIVRHMNKRIPHVVATSFGLNLRSDIGKAFLEEYYRLASETRAFCGPWANSNYLGDGWPYAENPPRLMPCGPKDVRGHRHDQTVASVIAWRFGMKLTDPPEIFAYPPGDDRTILLADGSYE